MLRAPSDLNRRMKMRNVFAVLMTACLTLLGGLSAALAHNGETHATKCKRGYVETDDHKCVKKP